jgi:hypothetical protein
MLASYLKIALRNLRRYRGYIREATADPVNGLRYE